MSAVDPILLAALKRDEGCRLQAYRDSLGIWTIGYGHTGPEVRAGLVWKQEHADAELTGDILDHNARLLKALPWTATLDPVRRRVLQNMAFNMGIGDGSNGLTSFHNTLGHVQRGEYALAAAGMLASLWAKQVKGRATRLAREMASGEAAP